MAEEAMADEVADEAIAEAVAEEGMADVVAEEAMADAVAEEAMTDAVEEGRGKEKRKEERVESVMPRKRREIEGVGAISILALKAQLYRSQQKAKASSDQPLPHARTRPFPKPNDPFRDVRIESRITFASIRKAWSIVQADVRSLFLQTPFAFIVKNDGRIPTFKDKEFLLKMIDSYDISSRKFVLGRYRFEITSLDVENMFGLKNEGEEIHLIEGKVKPEHRPPLWTDYFPEQGGLRPKVRDYLNLLIEFNKSKNISEKKRKKLAKKSRSGKGAMKNRIDQARQECKILVIIVLGSILFPYADQAIVQNFYSIVDNLESLQQYNWANAVCSFLLEGISDMKNAPVKDVSYVKGCISIYYIWAYDKFNIAEMSKPEANLIINRYDIKDFVTLKLTNSKINLDSLKESDLRNPSCHIEDVSSQQMVSSPNAEATLEVTLHRDQEIIAEIEKQYEEEMDVEKSSIFEKNILEENRVLRNKLVRSETSNKELLIENQRLKDKIKEFKDNLEAFLNSQSSTQNTTDINLQEFEGNVESFSSTQKSTENMIESEEYDPNLITEKVDKIVHEAKLDEEEERKRKEEEQRRKRLKAKKMKEEAQNEAKKKREEERKEEMERKKREEENKKREQEENKKREQEENKKREEVERRKREQEENKKREEVERRKREQEENKKREEVERRKREQEENKKREEVERRKREQEENKKREEVERRKREQEENKKREEVEKRKREEEEYKETKKGDEMEKNKGDEVERKKWKEEENKEEQRNKREEEQKKNKENMKLHEMDDEQSIQFPSTPA